MNGPFGPTTTLSRPHGSVLQQQQQQHQPEGSLIVEDDGFGNFIKGSVLADSVSNEKIELPEEDHSVSMTYSSCRCRQRFYNTPLADALVQQQSQNQRQEPEDHKLLPSPPHDNDVLKNTTTNNNKRTTNHGNNFSSADGLGNNNPADSSDYSEDRYPYSTTNINNRNAMTLIGSRMNPQLDNNNRHQRFQVLPRSTTRSDDAFDHSLEHWKHNHSTTPQLRQRSPHERPHQAHVHVAPGLSLRLRGAAETKEAIDHDFFLPTMCLSCQLDLYCIQDANYVVCPRCRVVTPMDDMVQGYDGGVGLGFTHDDLCRRQCEILYGTSSH